MVKRILLYVFSLLSFNLIAKEEKSTLKQFASISEFSGLYYKRNHTSDYLTKVIKGITVWDVLMRLNTPQYVDEKKRYCEWNLKHSGNMIKDKVKIYFNNDNKVEKANINLEKYSKETIFEHFSCQEQYLLRSDHIYYYFRINVKSKDKKIGKAFLHIFGEKYKIDFDYDYKHKSRVYQKYHNIIDGTKVKQGEEYFFTFEKEGKIFKSKKYYLNKDRELFKYDNLIKNWSKIGQKIKKVYLNQDIFEVMNILGLFLFLKKNERELYYPLYCDKNFEESYQYLKLKFNEKDRLELLSFVNLTQKEKDNMDN